MTDFDKIKQYYKNFNEKTRLTKDSSGKLEFEMTMRILRRYLPSKATILDLGGGTGVYTLPLAAAGYKMYLADLCENLINQAKTDALEAKIKNIYGFDAVNATDLSAYGDEQFDVVLLFGPFYHLTDKSERDNCIKEVNRVLKKGGLAFIGFIPKLSGSIGVLDRYFSHPEQVDATNLHEVFLSGKFCNNDHIGFQEGYYSNSEELEQSMVDNGFQTQSIRSIRGGGYGREDGIYSIQDEVVFNEVITLIEETSVHKEIIEMCGHAMYIGIKN